MSNLQRSSLFQQRAFALEDAALSVNFLYRDSDGSFGPGGVCRFVSRLLLGHSFRAILAPYGSSLFCFGCAALRVTVSLQILFAKFSEKDFSGASVNAELRRWEPGPSLGFAMCDQQDREIQQTETIMHQNKVNLIGFLGSDAEVHTANNHSFATLALATKSSYKDKKSSQYVSQTEWHRCVVFGNLSEFAGTLTKGAHVQVEGELRSHEYTSKKSDSKQRIWEIRVTQFCSWIGRRKPLPKTSSAKTNPRRNRPF